MFQILPFTSASSHYAAAEKLYLSAFPREERREVGEWKEMLDTAPLFKGQVVIDGAECVAFFTTWRFSNFLYLEHLAVKEEHRGRGIGQFVIEQLLQEASTYPLILEAEMPEEEQSVRRLSFYARQGVKPLPFAYSQPPYRIGDAPIEMLLLSNKEGFLEKELDAIVQQLKVYVCRL